MLTYNSASFKAPGKVSYNSGAFGPHNGTQYYNAKSFSTPGSQAGTNHQLQFHFQPISNPYAIAHPAHHSARHLVPHRPGLAHNPFVATNQAAPYAGKAKGLARLMVSGR